MSERVSVGACERAMGVSLLRLYLLRALYLLIGVGLGSIIWPTMFNHEPWGVMHSVANALLAALSLLALLGLRYPLQMLPLLLFEILWKTIWLLMIALPLWQANQLTPEAMSTVKDLILVVVMPFIIPWRYVWANYVKKPGDRWTRVR